MRAAKLWTQDTERLYHIRPWRFSNPNRVKPHAACSDLTADPDLGKGLG